jgi:hypothetical protein
MTLATTSQRRAHAGTTTLEVLVSFTLLAAVLAVSLPLVVQHGRLLATERAYRLALDELSNQLERLTALPNQELTAALSNVKPSEYAAARLPGARLSAQLQPAGIGQRLTLRLAWDEPQRANAPVTLCAWVYPRGEEMP